MVFTELIKVLVVAVFFLKKVNNNARLQLLPIKNRCDQIWQNFVTLAKKNCIFESLCSIWLNFEPN